MKQPFKLLCLLVVLCLFTGLQAQPTYVKQVNDTWHDDALVDLQFNTTHSRPEGLFKLGTGWNVIGFDEATGCTLSSKFLLATSQTMTPKCIAQAGAQCFVFCEDQKFVYFTSFNSVTGVIAYTKSFPRTDLVMYDQLSPVDADYDGTSTLHAVFSAKELSSGGAIWNLVHLKINVATGAINGGSCWGTYAWDLIPNDIEYIGPNHIYASGRWRLHSPTTNPYRHMVMNLNPTYPMKVFDVNIPGTRPRSCYVRSVFNDLYLVADSYTPTFLAAGPLAVLRVTDNNNGTMAMNAQLLYGAPGATFFIHDVQEGNGMLVASGELPVFSPGSPSAPRNFLYNSSANTANMTEYNLQGNVNIRTAFSTVSQRAFSVAKEDDMSKRMYDLRTDPFATTTYCRYTPLTYYVPVDPVTITPVNMYGKFIQAMTPNVVPTVDSYKQYTCTLDCNTRIAAIQEPFTTPAVTCFPNPTSGRTQLQHTEAMTRILLYDHAGRLLLQQVLPPGTQSAEVDLTPMPAGLYILEAESPSTRTRTKLIRK
jgi:hypothetical protein